MYLKCHDNSPLLGQTSSPETGDHGRSEREPGPGPGVIRIGHCLESNGTTGGRNGLMPSLALSLMDCGACIASHQFVVHLIVIAEEQRSIRAVGDDPGESVHHLIG